MIGSPTLSLTVRIALTLGAAAQGCTLETNIGHWAAPEDAEEDAGSEDAGSADAASADASADASEREGGEQLLTVIPGLKTTYFADGQALPAGDYTLVYVDGCWRSGVVSWTVNLGGEGYFVVGGQPEKRIATAPGTVGTFVTLGAYGTYDECVAANVGRPGITFHFDGGPLALKLESLDPLTLFIQLEGGENVGGRSPTFRLTCAGSCP